MIEIFLHRREKAIEIIEVEPGKKIEDLGIECLGEGAFVWLEDVDEALDPAKTLADAGVVHRCHVHVSLCKDVTVKVRYNGLTTEDSFSPATSGGVILKWAVSPENFKLTDSQSAKHLLAICGTDTDLDPAEHVGFFADDDCSICLDLVPKEKFAG